MAYKLNMAYKNYKIRDNWLDIDKYNDVDIQSVDGVIQTIKVNGQDAGGGSSDFSTAEVEVTNNMSKAGFTITLPHIEEDGLYSVLTLNPSAAVVVYVPLYQGKCVAYSDQAGGLVYTGDITRTGTDIFITGDGTITVNP